jgi:hypothetical protein
MRTSLLRQSIGCTATDVMSKGLGAILSTGDSRSANSAGAADCRLFLERCWDCPSILLNNCVPAAKDLPIFGQQDGFFQMV